MTTKRTGDARGRQQKKPSSKAPPFKFAAAEWKAIASAAPNPLALGANLNAARRELERAGNSYLIRQCARQNIRVALPKMRKTIKLIERAVAEVKKAGLDQHTLVGLQDALDNLFPHLGLHKLISKRGAIDPSRDQLYERVLVVWTRLGGQLRLSRSGERSKPGGRTIKFMLAAIGPVMKGETPKPEGLAAIIKRERVRRTSPLTYGVSVLKK